MRPRRPRGPQDPTSAPSLPAQPLPITAASTNHLAPLPPSSSRVRLLSQSLDASPQRAARSGPSPPSPLAPAPRGGGRGGKRRRGKMAAPREAAVAQRIDPAREPGLSPEQRRFMAQVELAQRQRALQKRLRGRNVLLALGIGAVTAGICILQGREGTGRGLGVCGGSRCAPGALLNAPQTATPSTRCLRSASWTSWSWRRRRRGPGPRNGSGARPPEGGPAPDTA